MEQHHSSVNSNWNFSRTQYTYAYPLEDTSDAHMQENGASRQRLVLGLCLDYSTQLYVVY